MPTDNSDPVDNYKKIRNELKLYSASLTRKPELIVLNKADLDPDAIYISDIKKRLKGKKVVTVSAVSGKGLDELKEKLWEMVEKKKNRSS